MSTIRSVVSSAELVVTLPTKSFRIVLPGNVSTFVYLWCFPASFWIRGFLILRDIIFLLKYERSRIILLLGNYSFAKSSERQVVFNTDLLSIVTKIKSQLPLISFQVRYLSHKNLSPKGLQLLSEIFKFFICELLIFNEIRIYNIILIVKNGRLSNIQNYNWGLSWR